MTNIFVGNLNLETTQEQLRVVFAEHGEVERVNLVLDHDGGVSKGFAFVEMADRVAAEKAIELLNGADLNGQAMDIS